MIKFANANFLALLILRHSEPAGTFVSDYRICASLGKSMCVISVKDRKKALTGEKLLEKLFTHPITDLLSKDR